MSILYGWSGCYIRRIFWRLITESAIRQTIYFFRKQLIIINRISNRIAEPIVYRSYACRIEIPNPRHLNRCWSPRKKPKSRETSMSSQVYKYIDTISTNNSFCFVIRKRSYEPITMCHINKCLGGLIRSITVTVKIHLELVLIMGPQYRKQVVAYRMILKITGNISNP